MAIGDIYRAVYYYRKPPVTAVNVTHLIRTNEHGASPPTDADVVDALSTRWGNAVANVLGPGCRYEGLQLQLILPVPGGPLISTAGASAGLQNGSDLLPPQIALLGRLRTALGGRHGRGRVYIPFQTEFNNTVDSRVDPAYLTGATPFFQAMIDTITLTGPNPADDVQFLTIVFDRLSGGYASVITAQCTLAQDWATCRRRSAFNGPDALPPMGSPLG